MAETTALLIALGIIVGGALLVWAGSMLWVYFAFSENQYVGLIRKGADRFAQYVAELGERVSALRSSEHGGTGGDELETYFDADSFLLREPDAPRRVVRELARLVRSNFGDAEVCFIEKDSGPVGVLLLAGLYADRSRRGVSVVRPRRDIEEMAIKGRNVRQGDRIVLIQDVVTTGFQLLEPIDLISNCGATVVGVVTLVDQERPRLREFESFGIPVVTAASLKAVNKFRHVDRDATGRLAVEA